MPIEPSWRLALFFLVGGYTAVHGLRRARERGETDLQWVRRRLWRIGRPVVAATVALMVLLPWLGAGTARVTVVLFLQPLWFMAVYAGITALTPLLLRFGLGAALSFAGVVAVLDLLSLGAPLSYLSVLPAWAFAYQLGIGWAGGQVTRRVAVVLLTGAWRCSLFCCSSCSTRSASSA